MKLFTLLTFVSLGCSNLIGQVTETMYPLSLGEQNAFVMEHKGADAKTVNKILEDAIKEYGKVKRNKKAKEWSCLQCEVPGISKPTNVYFKIDEGKGMTTSYTYFDDGTKFISSKNAPEIAERLKKSLKHVSYDVTRDVISEELKDEEKNLEKQNKEKEKLERKNEDLHEDIEDYRKKIAEAEKNIEKNLQEQEDKKMEIEQQARKVGDVTDRLNAVGKN